MPDKTSGDESGDVRRGDLWDASQPMLVPGADARHHPGTVCQANCSPELLLFFSKLLGNQFQERLQNIPSASSQLRSLRELLVAKILEGQADAEIPRAQ